MRMTSESVTDPSNMNWDPKSAPKLDFNECYYDVLEIPPFSDIATIKKAFYRLVAMYHPDTKESKEDKDLCNKQMMVLNNAYKILKDDESRYSYDSQLKRGLRGASARIRGAASNPSPNKAETAHSSRKEAAKYSRRYSDETQTSQKSESTRRNDVFVNAMFDNIAEYLRDRERNPYRYEQADANLSLPMKRKRAAAMRLTVEKMEEELSRNDIDWGEVTDKHLIERRIRDLNALNLLREQLIDLEYEIGAEEEEAEYRNRGRGRDYAQYDDTEPSHTPFDYTDLNNRSPWRQRVEQRRNPRRYYSSGNDAVIDELERLRKSR